MTLQTYKPSSHQLHTTHSLQRKKKCNPASFTAIPRLKSSLSWLRVFFLRFFRDDGGPDLVPPLVCCKELVVVLSQSFRLSLLLNLLSTSLRRCVKNRQRFGPDCSSLHFIRILFFEIDCIFLWWFKFTEFCHLAPKSEWKLNVRASTGKINQTRGLYC